MIEIKVYNKFNNTIKDFWLQLEKNAVQTPFHTFDWIKNWYSIVGHPLYNIKPQIIHISYKEETLAILPLGIRKKFGVKIIEQNKINRFVGDPEFIKNKLEDLARAHGAEELVILTITYDFEARMRSYQLLADAFGLKNQKDAA